MKKLFAFSALRSIVGGILFLAVFFCSVPFFHLSFQGKKDQQTKEPVAVQEVIGYVSDGNQAVQSLFFKKSVCLHKIHLLAATYSDTVQMETLTYSILDSRYREVYSSSLPTSEIVDNAYLELDLEGVKLSANQRYFLYIGGAAEEGAVCPTFYLMKNNEICDVLYYNQGAAVEGRALCAVYEYDELPMGTLEYGVYGLCLLVILLLANLRPGILRRRWEWIPAGIWFLLFGSILLGAFVWQDFSNSSLYDLRMAGITLTVLCAVTIVSVILYQKTPLRIAADAVYQAAYRFRPLIGVVFFGLLFAAQYLIASELYQKIGWDVGYVWDGATMWLTGGMDEGLINYFQLYPNNLGLAILIYLIRLPLQGMSMAGQYRIVVVITLLLLDFGIFMTYKLTKRLFRFSTAVLSTLLLTVLFGFNGYMIVPYTDTWTLFLPVTILYLYSFVKDKKTGVCRRILCGLCAGFLICWGFHLKPQVLIVVVAAVVTEACKVVRTWWRRKSIKPLPGWKVPVLCGVLALGVGAGAGIGSYCVAKTAIAGETDMGRSMPMTHFIMMGMSENPFSVGIGGFCYDDVNYSAQFGSTEEKMTGNINRIKDRFAVYGAAGYLKHLFRKAVWVMGDGTFAWQLEGGFYQEDYSQNDSERQAKLRELYYGRYGAYDDTRLQRAAGIATGVWFFVLLLFAVPVRLYGKKRTWLYMTALAGFGCVLFTLLFEGRSRYLINYLPMFAIVAAVTLRQFGCRAGKISIDIWKRRKS